MLNAEDKPERKHSSSDKELERGFGARLKEAIGKRSVLSFAKECGFSDSLVRKYLAGSLPGLDKALVMAETLGVSLEWLATGEGPMVVEYGRDAQEEPVSVEELGAHFEYAREAAIKDIDSHQGAPSPIPTTIYARLVGPVYELVPEDLGMREAVLERSVNILRAATNDDPVEMLQFDEEELRAIVTSARAAYKIAKRRRGV